MSFRESTTAVSKEDMVDRFGCLMVIAVVVVVVVVVVVKKEDG